MARALVRLPAVPGRAGDPAIPGEIGDLAVALFVRLAGARPEVPAALLDSSDHAVSPAPERSRHSILAFSWGPLAEEVTHARGVTTARTASGCRSGEEPFFAWLRENWEISAGGQEAAAPFQLGWVGWLGYGLKRETGSPDGAATSAPDGQAWVPPADAQLFRATHAVVIDHHAGSLQTQSLQEDPSWEQEVSAAVADLLGDGKAPARAEADPVRAEASAQTPAQQTPAQQAPIQLSSLQVRDGRESYLEKIRAAQEEIRRGTTYEVCLTTAVTAELGAQAPDDGGARSPSGLELFARLRERNRAPFTQYLRLPGTAGRDEEGGNDTGRAGVEILSTSPERYLSITPTGLDPAGLAPAAESPGSGREGLTVRSEPIKGTRPRGADPQEDAALAQDLRTHPKDRAENVMITDLVRNDLSVHAVPGSLRTERLCAVESYPSVHQMVSTVSARLEPGIHPAEVVSAAFPPGSMTGAPKFSTMDILEQLETGPRGPYSGVAGYFSRSGAADLSVLIRTAVLTGDGAARRLHLGLGGAITADSDPEAEWEEIRTKSAGVLGALGAEFPSSQG